MSKQIDFDKNLKNCMCITTILLTNKELLMSESVLATWILVVEQPAILPCPCCDSVVVTNGCHFKLVL